MAIPRALLLASLLAAVGCRSPDQVPDAPANAGAGADGGAAEAGLLGKRDVIEVHVFQEADFTGVYPVGVDGTIDFPFCKDLTVTGLTPEAVASKLTACLSPRVLKNPQITVSIKEYNSQKIFVLGDVGKAGTFPYESDMTIIQAITLAGGFSKTAAKNSITITRMTAGHESKIHVLADDISQGKAPNVALQPGDIIFVPESFF